MRTPAYGVVFKSNYARQRPSDDWLGAKKHDSVVRWVEKTFGEALDMEPEIWRVYVPGTERKRRRKEEIQPKRKRDQGA